MTSNVQLVVGLGNPGAKYDLTRHNVGFELLDHLALHEGLLFESSQSLEGYGGPDNFVVARMHDPHALLVKPLTFMNKSGEAVLPLMQWAGLAPARILIVFDDMDLENGVLRLRPHGGAGGQKGMQSILATTGSDRFPRMRVGIGRAKTDAAQHVLSRFTEAQRAEIESAKAQGAEALLHWLQNGDIEGCMTRFHSRWKSGSVVDQARPALRKESIE